MIPEVWQEWVPHRVRRQQKSMQAYMQWKTREFAEEHPEMPPPREVTLLIRCYPIAPPGTNVASIIEPVDRPLVRLRSGVSQLEYFDPVAEVVRSLDKPAEVAP
jgi:hypothetical protein